MTTTTNSSEGRKPDIITERMNVWCERITPSPENTPRMAFFATDRKSDWGGIVCSCTVMIDKVYPTGQNLVDWIETAEMYRGHDYAIELLEAIHEYTEYVPYLVPVTPSGEGLAAKWEPILAARLAATEGGGDEG